MQIDRKAFKLNFFENFWELFLEKSLNHLKHTNMQ